MLMCRHAWSYWFILPIFLQPFSPGVWPRPTSSATVDLNPPWLPEPIWIDLKYLGLRTNKQWSTFVFVVLLHLIVILFTVSSFFSFLLLFVILSSLVVNSLIRVFLFFLCFHCGRWRCPRERPTQVTPVTSQTVHRIHRLHPLHRLHPPKLHWEDSHFEGTWMKTGRIKRRVAWKRRVVLKKGQGGIKRRVIWKEEWNEKKSCFNKKMHIIEHVFRKKSGIQRRVQWK